MFYFISASNVWVFHGNFVFLGLKDLPMLSKQGFDKTLLISIIYINFERL